MTEKKKILYLTTKSVYGGAQRYIIDLIDYLPRDKFEFIVGAGGKGPLASKVTERHVAYYEVKGLARDVHTLTDIKSFFRILSLIRNTRPDILHLNGSKVSILGAIAGKLCGIKKIISSTHGWPFLEDRPKFQKKLLKLAARIGSLFQDKIICVSEFDYTMAMEEHIASPKKLIQIHNGIVPKKHIFLDRDAAREKILKRIGIPRDDYFIVGSIAEYTKNKGLVYLIEAAEHIARIKPKTLFLLIGWGEEREFLRMKIPRSFEKKIFLVDSLPEAFTYLKALDIFVLPSVKEGFAYTLLEASLAELPIVATQVGGNPEIIENLKNGVLVRPGSPHDILNAIFHLIRDPKERAQLGKEARKTVLEKFSITSMVDLTRKVYEEMS